MIWDIIIVGGGSAGCSLAYHLSRDCPDATILMIEAGGSAASPAIRIPACQGMALKTRSWGYMCDPDPTRSDRSESWLTGRVLGGGSSVNGTMYVRGARSDYDRWAARLEDNSGWNGADVMDLFRHIEASDQMGIGRGRSGPLHVRTVNHPHPLTQAFVEAAAAAGHGFNEDYNADSQDGAGYAQLTQRRGLRWSGVNAFLAPLKGRRNFRIRRDACVERLVFDGGKVSGVSVRSRNGVTTEKARNVVVCAGALNTPKLLMLSGIGDAPALKALDIPVVANLPGVGRNLREHPLIKLVFATNVPSYNLTGGWRQKIAIAGRFARFREGPVSNLFEGVAFLKTLPALESPDIQLHFLPIGYSAEADGAVKLDGCPSVTVLINKSHPRSSGTVSLRSPDPRQPPRIQPNLLSDEADIDTLVRAMGLVRTIMRTDPIARYISRELEPASAATDSDAMKAHIRSHAGIAYHPVGTCRMGLGEDAVVGSDLRVRGVPNLWIADASIMPDLISGNTNAACMMIGAKLGRELATTLGAK